MKNLHILTAGVLLAAASLHADAQSQAMPTVYDPGVTISAMSDNAVYAISGTVLDEDIDNPRVAGGSLIDLRTHTATDIDAPSGWADVNDVADNGTVVGSSNGRPGYWSPETGKWTTFKVPYNWGGGCFTAVTPDAHYAVGYYFSPSNEFDVAPMMYDLAKGEAVAVTGLPTVDMSGVNQNQNLFYGISPDGRYVLGQMSQSYLMPVALFSYIYDTQTSTWTSIGFDYNPATKKFTPQVEGLYFINNQHMSCDGNWVTGSAYMVFNGGELNGGSEGFYPYRYDVRTAAFEVYTTDADKNIGGNKITADGTVLASYPIGNPYPTAAVRYGKYFISLDQIFQQVYNRSPRQIIGDDVTGSFEALSADGLTAVMATYDNCYVITMPESFADLAAKVDLLANYSVNIPSRSKISRISSIEITFDRTISCDDAARNIRLLDSTGNTVRTASGCTISPTNDHTLVVTFRSTALKPGEKYTVDIPAGTVWLTNDKDIKSKNIQIHYTGREEGPVKVEAITPLRGSLLTEFNSNPDYITVRFDTPVSIAPDYSCALYNADDGTLLANFSTSAVGTEAYFFPTATYLLYKGSNYRVVISAGSVTDLSGAGGSEEIVLEYRGAYVRELSDDDIYIFNAPCDSYDNFIFWQDDFGNPGAVPTAWGFTSDNPWLLLRDNDSSGDWTLAAHSMFSPAAESNDWLITPQLHIPEAGTYLAFDAQSYLRSKDDVLKVYVYTDKALYNYFSAELADKFVNDGDLVFDEVIPAGATDSKIDGEWTHYSVPLDKYAGKDIYIAFVNKNYDKSAIFLNNIQVIRNMNFLLTNQTPEVVVGADCVTVSGILSIASETGTFNNPLISLLDADGNMLASLSLAGSLKYGDTMNYYFKDKLPLAPGAETPYTIEVLTDEANMTFGYTVKNLMFQPTKRVVLEEFTGSECGNCPLGIQAIANLERLYPDNFIPITIRTYGSDMYGSGLIGYTDYLGLSAAPTGRVNRGSILSPMLQNGSKGYEFFGRGIIMSDGNEAYLWADAVQDALNVPAEAEIDFAVDYDPQSGDISVPCQIKFALDRKDLSLSVFAVIVEDQLPAYQLNYMKDISDPNLGDWGAGGRYSQSTVVWTADDVARYVINGNAYDGTVMAESDFTADTEYTITLSANVPADRITNAANCSVVAMLIDRSTGRVINANKAAFGTSGIGDIITDSDAEAVYYDLNGIEVKYPTPGHIYIKVTGGNATKVRL